MGTTGVDTDTPRASPAVDPRLGRWDAIGVQLRICSIQPARAHQLHLSDRGHLVGPDSRLARCWRYRRILLRTSLGASPDRMCPGRNDMGSERAILRLPRAPGHVGNVLGRVAVRGGRAHTAGQASVLVRPVVRGHARLFDLCGQSADRGAHSASDGRIRRRRAALAEPRPARGEAGPPTDHRSGPCVGRRSRPLRAPCPSWPPTGKRLHQEFRTGRHRSPGLAGPRSLLPELLGAAIGG